MVVAAPHGASSEASSQTETRCRMLAMDLQFVPNSPEQAAARLRR